MKPDFNKWFNKNVGEVYRGTDIEYHEAYINDFAEDYAEQEAIELLYEYTEWFRKYVAPYGKKSHVRSFLHQKFKDDEQGT